MAVSEPTEERTLTAGTRERLIRAAIDIADTEGLAAITTVEVTRRAGIAQSSYYTHFASREELLEALGAIGAQHSRRLNQGTRARFSEDPRDPERQRDLFRVPLRDIRSHPDLFRLQLRARTEPAGTPLGRVGQEAAEANRCSLADDLIERADPSEPDGIRLRYEMFADCIIAMVEQLGIGALEGRYEDDEELVELLIHLTRGNRGLTEWLRWSDPKTS